MSFEVLREITEELPPGMKDQVLGYAGSVRNALPEIFLEAGIRFDTTIADQVILLAGIKKFYSICNSTFWTVDNSLAHLARDQIYSFRIGSQTYHRGSEFHVNVFELMAELEDLFRREHIDGYIAMSHYTDIVRALADER